MYMSLFALTTEWLLITGREYNNSDKSSDQAACYEVNTLRIFPVLEHYLSHMILLVEHQNVDVSVWLKLINTGEKGSCIARGGKHVKILGNIGFFNFFLQFLNRSNISISTMVEIPLKKSRLVVWRKSAIKSR